MDFQVKLKLSILILFVPVGFIALLQIITLNVIFITNFSKEAEQLSFAFYNETTQTTLKFRHQLETINLAIKVNAAFILQDLMKSNQGIELYQNLQQIQVFLQPIILRGLLENFKIICNDSFEYAIKHIDSYFQIWNSTDQASIEIYQEYFRFIVSANNNHHCNIQIFESISNLFGKAYRYTNYKLLQTQLNYFMINEQFYQFTLNKFLPIEQNILENQYGEFVQQLLNQQEFDKNNCLLQNTLIQNYLTNYYIYGWFYSIQKQHVKCEKQYISKLLLIKVFDIEQFKQLAGSSTSESDHNIHLIIAQSIISLTFLFYVWTISIKVSNSFCLPLQQLAIQLQNPLQSHFDSIPFKSIKQHCKEIHQLQESLQTYIYYYQLLKKQHSYADQDQGSHYLMTLSQLTQLYKYHKNNWQVSVCSNNIAQVHYKNKRYIEALKFQAKSVILGIEEYTSIKQIEKIRKQLLNSQKTILFQLKQKLKRFVINKLAGSTFILQSEHINRNRFQSFIIQNSYKYSDGGQQIYITERQPQTNQVKSDNSLDQMIFQEEQELREDQYKEEKRFYKLTILFRKYTFCRMLYKFCIKEQPSVINEAICSFNELYEEISNKNYSEQKSIIGIKISLLIMKFSCFQQLNLMERAQQELYSIKILYSQYVMSEKTKLVFNGYDIFSLQSKEMIQNAIRRLKICVLIKNQKFQIASEKCVKIIKKNSQNIYTLNSFAYKTLQNIFMTLNLNQDVLQKLYLDINSRKFKLFFLIDYSSKVSQEQIQVSHSLCSYIMQKLMNLREIGLYIFNDAVYEILAASQSTQYRKFLLRQLERFQILKGGECKVLECLYELLKYKLNIKQNKNEMRQSSQQIIISKQFQQQQEEFKQIMQRFVCIFSEFSTTIDEDLLEKIQKLIQKDNINLVLFNIANSNCNYAQAKWFAKQMNAYYIESDKEIIEWISHLNQSSMPIHGQGYLEFI